MPIDLILSLKKNKTQVDVNEDYVGNRNMLNKKCQRGNSCGITFKEGQEESICMGAKLSEENIRFRNFRGENVLS